MYAVSAMVRVRDRRSGQRRARAGQGDGHSTEHHRHGNAAPRHRRLRPLSTARMVESSELLQFPRPLAVLIPATPNPATPPRTTRRGEFKSRTERMTLPTGNVLAGLSNMDVV